MGIHIDRIAKNDQLKNRCQEHHTNADFITT
ncbi:Uncharacterised protein [Klebsiella pneumoniae]|nr:Uncharacterised protein [Klebsiella pneumoniae]SWI96426.1 Uncharacterised protein [Klebsiella pneumoniae]SWJ02813.1 Uncharacterised protein [Klebsiella pneumoniae]